MSSSYDPRRPRRNPEIKAILRCIAKTHSALQSTDNHTQRVGHARILSAHLQMLDDEPEHFVDLQPGTLEWTKKFPNESLKEHAKITSESPFQKPGSSQNLFFFYSSGHISNLYSDAAIDPYIIPLMHRHGPFIYSLEKRFASTAATTHHFEAPERLQKFISPSLKRPNSQHQFWLLADPLGVSGGGAPVVKTYATLKGAVKASERYGKELEIRFLVAEKKLEFLNR